MITIVVPLDGSKLAESVLPYVENLALRLHAEVFFIQTIEPPQEVTAQFNPGAVAVVPEGVAERMQKEAEDYLSGLATIWQSKDIYAKWEVLQGAPAASIVTFAKSHKAYMIAMSTHGRSGVGRLLLGSVADQVVRDSRIPVLVYRPVRID